MEARRLGPYLIHRELGKGGMGTVYVATVEEPVAGLAQGAEVAVKLIHPELLSDASFFKRFLREVEIGKAVQHENVVRTWDAGTEQGDGVDLNYIVMELVEGQTLRDLLDELGKVPEDLCRHIGAEVCKALEAVHAAGIIHRDVKPENVLITKDQVLKLMDLGCARLQEEAVKLSQTGQFVGSLLYAAPEQFLGGGGQLDGRADMYALGLVLYELATGRHPFRDDDIALVLRRQIQEEPRRPGDVNPQLSAYFEELLLQLLAKDREERFSDAGALARVLEEGEGSEWWQRQSERIRSKTKRSLRRIRIPRETALHGREQSLAQLRARFERARQGQGQVAIVKGEAGVGKTRLVDEFITRLQQDEAEVDFLFGGRRAGDPPKPYPAFTEALQEHLGAGIGLPQRLKDVLKDHPTLAPGLAAPLPPDSAPGGQPPTGESLAEAFEQTMLGLAARRPCVCLVEDLHAASEEERALFARLALAASSVPLLLIGTARRGLDREWEGELGRHGHVGEISLARLSPEDLQRLLRDALGSERLAGDLAAEIALKSDGKPFVVFEILRSLRENQFLRQALDGSWVSTSVIRKIDVPASVRDLVRARIAVLEEEDRELLEAAACLGPSFDPTLAGEALGLRRIPTLKRYARLEDRTRLVRSAGNHYEFDQFQIPEILYAELDDERRRDLHAAIADALAEREEFDPDDADDEAICLLASHALRGGRIEEARDLFQRALNYLEGCYRNEAAVQMADWALALEGLLEGAARAEVLLRKAERLGTLGLRDAESAALVEAAGLAQESGEGLLRARTLRALGWHLLSRSRLDEARTRLEQALTFARDAGAEDEEARITGLLGNVAAMRGHHEDARGLFEKHLALARAAGDHAAESIATGNLGVTLQHLGRYEEAHERYVRQLTLARETGNRTSEGVALANLGLLQGMLGHAAEARKTLEEARTLLRTLGDVVPEGYALHRLGEVAAQAGDATQAEMLYEQALLLWREVDYPCGVVEGLIGLGRLLARQDRSQEAVRHLKEALSTARALDLPQVALAAAHLAALADGEVDAARDALREQSTRLRVDEAAEARFALWRATQDREHLEEARRLLALLRDHAPAESRQSLVENVPLHREIVAA